jgi:flagellar FliL protein
MTDEADVSDEAPKKRSKLPLLLGVVLALAGGGGGFFAVQAGIVGGAKAEDTPEESPTYAESKVPDVAFVALDPVVISLPSSGGRDHLRFSAQLEVVPGKEAEVAAIKPRIIDVLNSYLRAVELAELEDPVALLRLRAQMLRRVQVVAGPDRVKDLLIMEFVLS